MMKTMICDNAPSGPARSECEQLTTIRQRITEAFDDVFSACLALRGAPPVLQRALAQSLSTVLGVSQAADAISQRLDHICAALDRDSHGQHACHHDVRAVLRAQLDDIADQLRGDADRVHESLDHALMLAARADVDLRAPVDSRSGIDFLVEELRGTAMSVAATASALQTHETRRRSDTSDSELRWLEALYTMDRERLIHRQVVGALHAQATR